MAKFFWTSVDKIIPSSWTYHGFGYHLKGYLHFFRLVPMIPISRYWSRHRNIQINKLGHLNVKKFSPAFSYSTIVEKIEFA